MLKPGPHMGLELILDSKISYVAVVRFGRYRGRIDPHMLSMLIGLHQKTQTHQSRCPVTGFRCVPTDLRRAPTAYADRTP